MKIRDKFAVAWLVFLFLISWGMSLAHLLGTHFWDKRYALKTLQEPAEGINQGFKDIQESYCTPSRFGWFVPHVVGAVLWWNLYFLQLIPKIRHWRNKSFHRFLGRFLLIILIVQTVSGIALAATSHSNVIKVVSFSLGIATAYCIFKAWRYAFWRDIPRHKYWVIRLVGYMQTISLQRFWLFILIVSHQIGNRFDWVTLYPRLEDDSPAEEWKEVVNAMFDDSFILSILHAFLGTEWYLAGEQGMLDTPENRRTNDDRQKEANESSSSFPGSNYGSVEEEG